MTQSIAIIIPYFGEWPEWIDFFVESCRANPTIDWFLIGDAPPPENRAGNVRHVAISFDDYKARLSEKLGSNLSSIEPYKLCDLKPALPFVHEELVRRYDFVGFGDLDVIYGDIRSFYDEATLNAFDVLSSHRDRISGHLFLMRNREELVTLFQRLADWKRTLASATITCFDERSLFNALRSRRRLLGPRPPVEPSRMLLREAYSTPGATDRMRWYWADGVLTNEDYPHHPFMYLHFMSWHSNRWLDSQNHVRPGAKAPWQQLDQIVQMDWRRARKEGFMISPQGIQSIERATYG